MAVVDLSDQPWTVAGWRPFCWRMGKSAETGGGMKPDIAPVPAAVPGSVQQTLLDAGIIEDWHVGLNSRLCEWVEHRHWDFTTELPAGLVSPGEAVFLDAQGLDYWGWVLVDGEEVARFQGALIPHRIDLSDALGDGAAHQLSIVFEEPPREQGQFGYTSRSRYFKPRYNYSWDWCPRFVPIGVWDSLSLVTGPETRFDLAGMRATLADDNQTGRVDLTVEVVPRQLHDDAAITLEAVVTRDDCELARASMTTGPGSNRITLDGLQVEPWWPNGAGDQPLYNVTVEARSTDGALLWSQQRRAGFKRVEWMPCEGATPDAEPWICTVNGKAVFLQGVNWSPLRVGYPDTTDAEYARLVELYRDMGCTAVRVWGGAILEKACFYDLCDAAGILVWQEFPLSSSGIDNLPPDDPDVIADMTRIAASYIRRRSHHVSLLLWSGGNELLQFPEGKTEGMGAPVDCTHPCIAALRDLVAKEDPGHRFIATSPSGPSAWGTDEGWGKGVHHDVHGPWGMGGTYKDMDAWRAYWAKDDALFRSETGMPGACDAALLERYCGGMQVFPPEGEYWRHTAAWWTEWLRLEGPMKGKSLADYVGLTQHEQAEAYAVAATACKDRFPRCGGFLIWMGHDCFPCPTNNSVIDFERNPKPAYHALKEVFLRQV